MDEENNGQELDLEAVDQHEEQLPDDPEALKALVAQLKADKDKGISEANSNAAKLRIKKKGAEAENEQLKQELAQYKEKERAAKLAEMSEAEKLKTLLNEKDSTVQNTQTALQKAQQEASMAKLENQLLMADATPTGIKVLKGYVAERMSEDSELTFDQAVAEIKKEVPTLFRQTKTVEKPADSGLPPGAKPKKDPPTPKPEQKAIPAYSKNSQDRADFKAMVKANKARYGNVAF